MGLFDWLTRRRKAQAPQAAAPAAQTATSAPAEPDSAWHAGIDGGTLWMVGPDGNRRATALDELTAIAIETSDYGPDGRGAWWLFYGMDEDIAFTLPTGARGEGAMVEHIAALPGFRHHAYAAAVRSPEVDTFVIWQRPFD